ncbi:MAG: hypothetical protein E6713_16795 [Sporomusaceae bacterium]|nr:hypothetical protein [Sporomusaceae bacterium]
MNYKQENIIDCVGTVNIVLTDRVVLQGQIIKDRHHDEPVSIDVTVENQNEFITVDLTCDAMIVRDNADLEIITPALYAAGDRVRVNISEIASIGPSHGCPEDVASEPVCVG